MSLKEGLHIHRLTDFNLQSICKYDFVVLGGVFCSLTGVDNNIDSYLDICEKIRIENNKVRIYFQQPFYCKETSDLFADIIIKVSEMSLIDGVLVNSPSIVRYFDDSIEMVISRFAVGKRKRINHYFYDLLSDRNIIAMECFEADTELMADVKQYSNLPIWVREGRMQFPPKCFMKNASGPCTNQTKDCRTCVYQQDKNDMRAAEQDGILARLKYYKNCDSIIHNVSGYEI